MTRTSSQVSASARQVNPTPVERIRVAHRTIQDAESAAYWLAQYDAMGPGDRALVDTMWREATATMAAWGVAPARDERSAALVAALARFVLESRQ
jgi:hypothetical protein